MSSLNQIVSNILELYNGGRISDDYRPSKRQIKFIVQYWRATLIRRDIDRNGFLSNTFRQPLGCIELELAGDCCDSDCKEVTSVNEIPRPVRLKDKDAIWLYTKDEFGATPIPIVSRDALPYLSARKYTKNKLYAVFENNRIKVFGNKRLREITGWIITEDPSSLAAFYTCEDAPCYSDDDEYPISADMIQQLTLAIMSGELKIMASTPEDTDNNATHG